MPTPVDVDNTLQVFKQALAQYLADASEDAALAAFVTGSSAAVDIAAADGAAAAAAAPEVAVPVLIVGLVVLVIAFAFKWIVTVPLAWLASFIPFGGGWLSQRITDAGNWEWNLVTGIASGVIHAILTVFSLVWNLVILLVVGVPSLLLATANLLAWVIGAYIPQEVGALLGNIAAAYHGSVNYTTQVLDFLSQRIDGVVAALQSYIGQVYSESIAYTQQTAGYLETQIASVATAVEVDLASLHEQLEAEISTDVHELELGISNAETQAQNYADQQIGKAMVTLETVLGAGIAAVAALAGGIGNDLKNLQTTCTDDLCEANSQNAKNSLNLGQLLTNGAIFAFFAACIRDPEGTANASAPVLVPVGAAAGQLVDTLVTAVV